MTTRRNEKEDVFLYAPSGCMKFSESRLFAKNSTCMISEHAQTLFFSRCGHCATSTSPETRSSLFLWRPASCPSYGAASCPDNFQIKPPILATWFLYPYYLHNAGPSEIFWHFFGRKAFVRQAIEQNEMAQTYRSSWWSSSGGFWQSWHLFPGSKHHQIITGPNGEKNGLGYNPRHFEVNLCFIGEVGVDHPSPAQPVISAWSCGVSVQFLHGQDIDCCKKHPRPVICAVLFDQIVLVHLGPSCPEKLLQVAVNFSENVLRPKGRLGLPWRYVCFDELTSLPILLRGSVFRYLVPLGNGRVRHGLLVDGTQPCPIDVVEGTSGTRL